MAFCSKVVQAWKICRMWYPKCASFCKRTTDLSMSSTLNLAREFSSYHRYCHATLLVVNSELWNNVHSSSFSNVLTFISLKTDWSVLCREAAPWKGKPRVPRHENQSSNLGAQWPFGAEEEEGLRRSLWGKHMQISGWSGSFWNRISGVESMRARLPDQAPLVVTRI